MGSGFSLFTNGSSSSSSRERDLLTPGLGDLPESCVASILENLDPVEICRFSKLNRAFHSASWADFVWESKLPQEYRLILEKIIGGFPEKLRKRDIYNFLSRVNSFDHGTKVRPLLLLQLLSVWSFPWIKFIFFLICRKLGWINEPVTSVYTYPPRDCRSPESMIGDTGIKFRLMSLGEISVSLHVCYDRKGYINLVFDSCRFGSVAYLQQIWWFQVDGEIDFPFPAGTYSVFFRLHLGKPGKRFGWKVCNTEQIHGWNIKPARFQIWTEDGQHSSSQCMLTGSGSWNHYHAGDFVVGKSKSSSTKLKFSMTQIDCTHTKGGLCVDSVIVYPSSCKDRLRRV